MKPYLIIASLIVFSIALGIQHFHYYASRKRKYKQKIKDAYEEGYNLGLEEKEQIAEKSDLKNN